MKSIVKPEDCVLAIGIPIRESDYFHDINRGIKDFAINQCSGPSSFKLHIENEYKKVESIYLRSGLKIVANLTLKKFKGLFTGDAKVIILFSHWVDDLDLIEFWDDLYSVNQVVKVIPCDFSGFLDLTICHPEKLATQIRKKIKGTNTKFIHEYAKPVIWLQFYSVLFELLFQSNLTYNEALEKVTIEFLKN